MGPPEEGGRGMRPEQWTRILALCALGVALVALAVAGSALRREQDRERQVEALGDLIRQSSTSGRPIMDMGPPGDGRPELDRGD
jgi:hypothetical protein